MASRPRQKGRITDKNWQRLKNLAIFRVWATDRELRPLMPLVALIAFIILISTALWWWFHA
jgi:hypothetical protein